MKILPRLTTTLLCLILLFLPQILATTQVHATPEREWTFMVYLDADNDLEPAGIKDINEMETVGSLDTLAIIVQMDRIPNYDSSNNNWTHTRRYYVTKDNDTENINSVLLEDMSEQNMGDNNTLSSFVNWAIQTYPAQHYALILWDHGGPSATGPGACWDDTNSQEDCLTMPEMKKALADVYGEVGEKIDVLAFDACLMGMIEIAYQIHDYVDYTVSSEETEPNDGYPYDTIIAELAAAPSMSPAQLSTAIVAKYVGSYTDGLPSPEDAPHVTSAALSLTEVVSTASAVSQLAEALIGDFNDSESAVKAAWEQAETFRGDFVDLYNFTQLLDEKVSNVTINALAETVLDAVDSLVISEGHGTVHSNAHGVSIYYPKKYNRSYYMDLDFASDTQWDDFLDFATNIDAEITPECPAYTSEEDTGFMDVAVGDVDGDQELEIVAVGNCSEAEEEIYITIAVFDLTENGLILLCDLTLSLGYYEILLSVSCADTDGDMLDEIVACGGYYDVSEDVWYSYIGVFTLEGGELVLQAYDEGANISVESLDVADVDGDDFPEIIISGYCWDEFYAYAYVAVGNNSAVTSIDLECVYYWDIGDFDELKSVVVGDTDADGLAEIVVGGEYYDYYYGTWMAYVAVLNCSQNMLHLQAYDSGVNCWINSVDVADLDGNGLNEVVISGYYWDYYYNIYMFISIGSNTNPSEIIGLGTYYWSVSGDSYICSIDVADVEGDGIAEIIAVGYYYDTESYTYKSCTVVLSWDQTTGLVTENILEGDDQTYTYSVETENVDDGAQTEIVTCSQEKGSSSRAKIEVFEASNNVMTTGTVSGTVTDGENPISNAIVEISIPRLSIVASVSTPVNGSFTIENIPEGCYTIKVYAEGKVNLTRNGLAVEAGQTIELDFSLIENAVSAISHPINIDGQVFHVVTVSNSTISNFIFNSTAKTITFSVSAATSSGGFCNVTIPKILLGSPYTVKIDNVAIQSTISSNETHAFIHFVYTHSVHTIKIVGATAIPEFSTSLLMLISAYTISLLVLLFKKRQKL